MDYDDAAYFKYSQWPALRNKIPRLMATATAVVAGNQYLADFARRYTPRVWVIPSVVDLGRYPNRQEMPATCTVRIVWIGTPITAKMLRPILPVLRRLSEKHPNLDVRLIGAGQNFSCDGLRLERLGWSEQTEARLLVASDIGIMPLLDSEFARGKCGLKLVQYMAAGLPVVASPVGANDEIVQENRTGFLPTSTEEWLETLDKLIGDVELRRRMGEAGRARVAAHYTVHHGFSKWLEVLEEALKPTRLTPKQILPQNNVPQVVQR
jgi:glycosyltransferase involved in cell wall biosynthesis